MVGNLPGVNIFFGPAGPTTFETPVSFIYWVNLFGPVIGPEIIGLVTKFLFLL